jgi:hypothetical protein
LTRLETPDPAGATGDQPDRPRPSRPAAVELAAAILIVGGTAGLIGLAASASSLPPGTEPFVALTLLLDVGAIVLGLLIRLGRFWILGVNYAAVLGFIDLLGAGGSPLALMLGIADIAVVVILFLHRPWFDAVRQRRTDG